MYCAEQTFDINLIICIWVYLFLYIYLYIGQVGRTQRHLNQFLTTFKDKPLFAWHCKEMEETLAFVTTRGTEYEAMLTAATEDWVHKDLKHLKKSLNGDTKRVNKALASNTLSNVFKHLLACLKH